MDSTRARPAGANGNRSLRRFDFVVRGRLHLVRGIPGGDGLSPHTARQTSSIITRRPTMAAARCRLESVMSLFGFSSRSTWVRLVLSSVAILIPRYFLFVHGLVELPSDDFLDGLRLRLFKDALLLQEIINARTHMVPAPLVLLTHR